MADRAGPRHIDGLRQRCGLAGGQPRANFGERGSSPPDPSMRGCSTPSARSSTAGARRGSRKIRKGLGLNSGFLAISVPYLTQRREILDLDPVLDAARRPLHPDEVIKRCDHHAQPANIHFVRASR
jgi:hypothetical protein